MQKRLRPIPWLTLVGFGLDLGGCVGQPPSPPDIGEASSTGIVTSSTGVGEPPPSSTSLSSTSLSSTGDEPSTAAGESSTGAIGEPMECDVWAQDCPAGEKCMPWADDGGNAWNATRCSPVADEPGQVGDACTVEGSGVSGIDDCDEGSMCFALDPATDLGTCVAFCEGTEAAPSCAPGYRCSISNGGVLILCRPVCDPLLQDCPAGDACLPINEGEAFVCIIDASGDMGAPGDPCEALNACDPGLLCVGIEAVPDCAGSVGCCTQLCDITAADPDAGCSLLGQVCQALYLDGRAPPGLEDVGVCALPV